MTIKENVISFEERSQGFRIRGRNEKQSQVFHHYLGGMGENIVHCDCCKSPMLAGWDLDWTEPQLQQLFAWHLPRFTVYVCPNCDAYQAPVWIELEGQGRSLSQAKSMFQVTFSASLPYLQKAAELCPLADKDYPTSEANLIGLLSREREPGIYHQIGGNSLFKTYSKLNCHKCNKRMPFVGILDYDVENFELSDSSGETIGLEIGDCDYLEVFACTDCCVVATALCSQ